MSIPSMRGPFVSLGYAIPGNKRHIGVLLCAMALMVFCFGVNARAGTTHVDVLYMNHAPMQPTVKELKNLFSKYGEKIGVSWYDLDTREAQAFAAKKGIHEHLPLSIWIDGSQSITRDRKVIKLVGFPSGSGPEPFQGDWTVKDLEVALDQAVATRR
ncbi:MAG TPA: hypothetical protein VL354_09445 [Spirochaetia bacterium]|nr:hypothetical protein [Spirochaetia bacterium]